MKKYKSIHPYIYDYHFYYYPYKNKYPTYDGSFGFHRYMGTLKWSGRDNYECDRLLIDKVKKKFNKIQCTFNFDHNGFSVDYIKKSDCDAIYKFLVSELRERHTNEKSFPFTKKRNLFKGKD